jgi:uncharacterized protein
MGELPARELLEATHRFPCQYTFKVIGRTADDFPSRVLELVRQALEQEFDPPYRTTETANGRHVSVSVEAWVSTPEDVLAVYSLVKQVDGLVMLW